jgi:hypothetical protein
MHRPLLADASAAPLNEETQQAQGNEPFDEFIYKLFAAESYYTLLFDNEEEMDMASDSVGDTMQVEWFYLKPRTVEVNDYRHLHGAWTLQNTHTRQMKLNDDDEDFVSFYSRFATDTTYQRRHILDPLTFITIDPDDEFSILETTLDIDQWYAFSPVLPTEKLSNINYGQQNEDHSPTKILKVNGVGNGYSNIFYFRKQQGEWELYKYEDTSV